MQEFLKEEPYTAEEIEEITGEKLTSILSSNAAYLEVLKVAQQFKLHQVFLILVKIGVYIITSLLHF